MGLSEDPTNESTVPQKGIFVGTALRNKGSLSNMTVTDQVTSAPL
jgi:hypothetical protein